MTRHAFVLLAACAIAALVACDRRDMPENQPTPQPAAAGEDPSEPADEASTTPEASEERPPP